MGGGGGCSLYMWIFYLLLILHFNFVTNKTCYTFWPTIGGSFLLFFSILGVPSRNAPYDRIGPSLFLVGLLVTGAESQSLYRRRMGLAWPLHFHTSRVQMPLGRITSYSNGNLPEVWHRCRNVMWNILNSLSRLARTNTEIKPTHRTWTLQPKSKILNPREIPGPR